MKFVNEGRKISILKMLGSLGIVVSSMIFYGENQRYQSKKIRQMNAFISLIEHIKNMIQSYMLPIDKILCRCDAEIMKECGISTCESDSKSLKDIFESAEFYINSDAVEVILNFASEFGGSYATEQVRLCERCCESLTKLRDKQKETLDKERKVNFAICLSISLSAILLLI